MQRKGKKEPADPTFAFDPRRGRALLDLAEAGIRPGRARRRIVGRFTLPGGQKQQPPPQK